MAASHQQHEQTERILLDAGLVDSLQLSAARRRMRRAGGTLPGSLVRMGLVPESRVLHLLSRGYSLGVADRTRLRAPQAPALELLDFEDAWQHRILPLRLEQRGGQKLLEVALADPETADTLSGRNELQGVEFLRLLAGERELERAIEAAYGKKATPFRPVALDSAAMRESIGQELYPLREEATDEDAAPPEEFEVEVASSQTEFESAPATDLVTEAYATESYSEESGGSLPEVELEFEPAERWQEVPAGAAHLRAEDPPEDPEGEAAREDAMAENPSFELIGAAVDAPAEGGGSGGSSKELLAVRVLLELLESKGILTREEYVAALRRAGKQD